MDEAYSGAADLAGDVSCKPSSYGLIPKLLAAIGYQDPDGFNLVNDAQGFLYLRWAGDFMAHVQRAIVAAWAVAATLAHWRQTISSLTCYKFSSYLCLFHKGCRPVLCMKRQQQMVFRSGCKRANKPATIFQHLTLFAEAQSLKAQKNRLAANGLTWRFAV